MIVSTGTTITFPISAFNAQLTSFEWRDISRSVIEDSAFSSNTAKTFRPDKLSDGGVLEGTVHFNPDQPPPLEGSAERVKITFPDRSTWSALMFLLSFDFQGELDAKIVAKISLKVSGEITLTQSFNLTPVINDDFVTVVNDNGDTVYTPS